MKSLINVVIEKLFGKKIPKISENYVPYVEEDTECDKCKHLDDCKNKGMVLRSTTSYDTREHYVASRQAHCLGKE